MRKRCLVVVLLVDVRGRTKGEMERLLGGWNEAAGRMVIFGLDESEKTALSLRRGCAEVTVYTADGRNALRAKDKEKDITIE